MYPLKFMFVQCCKTEIHNPKSEYTTNNIHTFCLCLHCEQTYLISTSLYTQTWGLDRLNYGKCRKKSKAYGDLNLDFQSMLNIHVPINHVNLTLFSIFLVFHCRSH